MLRHHLDHSTLVRYASGDLDEAFMVVVASHLAVCETCRNEVRAMENAGGELLASHDAVPVASNAFDTLMSRIDNEASDPIKLEHRPRLQSSDPKVPLPLRSYLPGSLDSIRWRTVAPGVQKFDIWRKPDSSLYMLKIAAGKSVPEHGHGGSEMTMVLSGAYHDSLGRFGAGDIADLDEHLEHQPKVEAGEACICLVATEAPTRFKGLISRMMQPLVGV